MLSAENGTGCTDRTTVCRLVFSCCTSRTAMTESLPVYLVALWHHFSSLSWTKVARNQRVDCRHHAAFCWVLSFSLPSLLFVYVFMCVSGTLHQQMGLASAMFLFQSVRVHLDNTMEKSPEHNETQRNATQRNTTQQIGTQQIEAEDASAKCEHV